MLFIATWMLAWAAAAQQVSPDDFRELQGDWSGQLTYLDYTSGKDETIVARLSASVKNQQFELAFSYPIEPGRGGKDLYTIRDQGRMINDLKVLERSVNPGGLIRIVLEQKGTDGNDFKPATFHHILEIGKNKFTLTKMVRYEGDKNFFRRNTYTFSR